MSLKARITAWLVRDVKRLAEQAQAQHCAADVQHKEALAKLAHAERQAAELRRMDQRNHYTESLNKAYLPKERPA
jgi:hypothetical protein